ncbi:MAG: PQQ-binding-like beta-propeller repeat protein [Acidobacteriota bacterium]
MKLVIRPLLSICLLLGAVSVVANAQAPAPDGEALFNDMCTTCHNGSLDRAPNREALRAMTADRVLAALESGAMVSVTSRRSSADRRAIASFASGKTFSLVNETIPSPAAMCSANVSSKPFNSQTGPQWIGWGQNTSNDRFQKAPGLTATDIPKLKLKWAFGFPTDIISNAQSTIAGGRVFVGSNSGIVYSLDAASGCIHWYFQAPATVRTGFNFGTVKGPDGKQVEATFFGDLQANMYAADARTGKLLWKVKVDPFQVARVTGSPKLYNGRLYVPVASGEEGPGGVPTYECCRFRGSVVALDAATGKQIWKTFTIDQEAKPTKKNKIGTQLWGPSGAPIWSSPAIDAKLNRLYVTTGNNYSEPSTRTSDAFIAMDLATGKILWTRQMTESDAYDVACRMPDTTNCPDSDGPDYDFAASPILVTLSNGKRAIVAGQKSAYVHAIDPDQQGEVIWSKKIGRGGSAGGIQWGSAADAQNVYVGLSDIGRVMLTYSQNTDADPKVGGGMFAFRLTDGVQVWHTAPTECGTKPRCSPAQSAAISAMPGVAFSGSEDGHMRAYATATGKVIWDYDTSHEYKTVNGVPGRGGSMDGPGPAIAGGMVLFNSGYPTSGGQPGNMLLMFTVDGK